MKTKIFLMIIVLSCFYYCSKGQSKGVAPLHQFFQQHADSTVIVEYPTYGYDAPTYRMITKTGNLINCFVYNPLDTSANVFYQHKKDFPEALWNVLLAQKTSFKNRPAEINIFFNLVNLPKDTATVLWSEILKLNPWQLKDDKAYGYGCPKDKPGATVVDGGYDILHLITKKEIKTLIYNSPVFYEEQCPGNQNRQRDIKIQKLFKDVFENNNVIKEK